LFAVRGRPGPARAGVSEVSTASEDLDAASGVVLIGSMSMLAASGEVVVTSVVTSVETVDDGIVVVLKGASDAASASIKLSGQAARGFSVATGNVVSVIAVSTGHALVLSEKIIAYIPNEIGKSLLHHSLAAEPGA